MNISKKLGVALAVNLLNVGLLLSQVTTATISGVVRDTTGAVAPGVAVAVKNLGTGITRTAVTDDGGRYQVTQLALGNYEVQATLAGFKTEVRSGIELTVGREAVVDMVLNVGEVAERIVVTGEAPLVETTTSSMGGTVGEKVMRDLPLNGRDFTQLGLLVPGVINATGTFNVTALQGTSRRIAVAGTRAAVGGTYLLDSTSIMAFWNDHTGASSLGTALGVDAIREFKVETNNFSAEYGHAGGSVINAVTRAGTNELHGGLFEFLRNSALDARNFFDRKINPSDPSIPPFKRNQFGGNLGGSIVKEKTFFFVNYEGIRERLGRTETGGTPTPAARQGILPAGQVTVHPDIKPLLNLLPLPNGRDLGGGVGELITTGTKRLGENYFAVRIDHRISNNDSLFARYVFDGGTLWDPYPGISTGAIDPIFGQDLRERDQYITLQESKIFTNNIVNSFRLSFNRAFPSGSAPYRAPELDFVPGEDDRQAANVTIAGVTTIGQVSSSPFYLIINNGTLADDLNIIKGPHTIKLGVQWEKIQNPYELAPGGGGSLRFNNLSDLLTGNPFSFSSPLPGKLTASRTWQQNVIGMYFWDSYKLRSNFTLNAGLRYEFITNPTERYGRYSNLLTFSDSDLQPFPNVYKKNPSLRNFDPRFGFAWDVGGSGKTSVRGGFGIFHQQYMPRNYASWSYNLPYTVRSQAFSPGFPPSIAALAALPPQMTAVSGYNITASPYMLQYNLNIQQEIRAGTVLSVGYVGSGGRRLIGSANYNLPPPTGALPDGTPVRKAGTPRPNPNFGDMQFKMPGHSSNYNALLVSLEKRFARGARIFGAWTYSHSLDTSSAEVSADSIYQGAEPIDINDLRRDHASSAFDFRHNLVINYIYELPFGAGRTFGGSWTGIGQKLLGGWDLTGIQTFTTGAPMSAWLSFDRARDLRGGSNNRPNLKSGFSNNPVLGSPDQWFDPNAFELQPDGTYGNLGRATIRGPGLVNVDFGLSKNIGITEKVNARFRFEAFNLFNRPNFAMPPPANLALFLNARGDVNPQAAKIRLTNTTSRQLQLGLRLEF